METQQDVVKTSEWKEQKDSEDQKKTPEGTPDWEAAVCPKWGVRAFPLWGMEELTQRDPQRAKRDEARAEAEKEIEGLVRKNTGNLEDNIKNVQKWHVQKVIKSRAAEKVIGTERGIKVWGWIAKASRNKLLSIGPTEGGHREWITPHEQMINEIRANAAWEDQWLYRKRIWIPEGASENLAELSTKKQDALRRGLKMREGEGEMKIMDIGEGWGSIGIAVSRIPGCARREYSVKAGKNLVQAELVMEIVEAAIEVQRKNNKNTSKPRGQGPTSENQANKASMTLGKRQRGTEQRREGETPNTGRDRMGEKRKRTDVG